MRSRRAPPRFVSSTRRPRRKPLPCLAASMLRARSHAQACDGTCARTRSITNAQAPNNDHDNTGKGAGRSTPKAKNVTRSARSVSTRERRHADDARHKRRWSSSGELITCASPAAPTNIHETANRRDVRTNQHASNAPLTIKNPCTLCAIIVSYYCTTRRKLLRN